ncbi:MAG TPA: hypothetical protein VIX20_06240, partial [Ktedonobacteraceae bacterium]
MQQQKAFQDLAISKKKNLQEKAVEEAEGRRQQEAILAMLSRLPETLFKDRPTFDWMLDSTAKSAGPKLSPHIR